MTNHEELINDLETLLEKIKNRIPLNCGECGNNIQGAKKDSDIGLEKIKNWRETTSI